MAIPRRWCPVWRGLVPVGVAVAAMLRISWAGLAAGSDGHIKKTGGCGLLFFVSWAMFSGAVLENAVWGLLLFLCL